MATDEEFTRRIEEHKQASREATANGEPRPPSIRRHPKTGEIVESKRTREEMRVEAAEKAKRAAELRMKRYSWDQIAERVGYKSRSAAYEAVQKHIRNIPREAIEELRRYELESLDAAERTLADRISEGDDDAINTMLKVKTHRARLTGLFEDTGTVQDVTLLKVQVATEIARIIKQHPELSVDDVVNEITKK